jgi:hypothetical protein
MNRRHYLDTWVIVTTAFLIALFGGGYWYSHRNPTEPVSEESERSFSHYRVTVKPAEGQRPEPDGTLVFEVDTSDTSAATGSFYRAPDEFGIAITGTEVMRYSPDAGLKLLVATDLGMASLPFPCAVINHATALNAGFRCIYCVDESGGPIRKTCAADGGAP